MEERMKEESQNMISQPESRDLSSVVLRRANEKS